MGKMNSLLSEASLRTGGEMVIDYLQTKRGSYYPTLPIRVVMCRVLDIGLDWLKRWLGRLALGIHSEG
jgi:hypothetical protein